MLVVSGFPNSGTSLMMDVIRAMLGHDRIYGDQYPVKEGASENINNALRYIYEKQNFESQENWGCKYTNTGIKYSIKDIDQLHRIKSEARDKISVCKLAAQGLYYSDPSYIDKVILVIGNPRFTENIDLDSPSAFIHAGLWTAKWLQANPQIPVHIILLDDLSSDSEHTLVKLSDFLGEGIVQNAIPRIRRYVKSETFVNDKSDLWNDAEIVYEFLLKCNWNGIISHFVDGSEIINENKEWYCTRRGVITTKLDCENCMLDPVIRNNFRKTATERNINWIKEPCMFEIAFDQKSKSYLTIQESIDENFWLHNLPVGEDNRILP